MERRVFLWQKCQTAIVLERERVVDTFCTGAGKVYYIEMDLGELEARAQGQQESPPSYRTSTPEFAMNLELSQGEPQEARNKSCKYTALRSRYLSSQIFRQWGR